MLEQIRIIIRSRLSTAAEPGLRKPGTDPDQILSKSSVQLVMSIYNSRCCAANTVIWQWLTRKPKRYMSCSARKTGIQGKERCHMLDNDNHNHQSSSFQPERNARKIFETDRLPLITAGVGGCAHYMIIDPLANLSNNFRFSFCICILQAFWSV
jgi:hypothetical protein